MTSGWALTHTPCDHVPQHSVEDRPGLSCKKRINPNKDTVAAKQLLAHLIRDIIGIDRGLRLNAERGHRLENAMKSTILWRKRLPIGDVPGPE
jgi:hypothetical protein